MDIAAILQSLGEADFQPESSGLKERIIKAATSALTKADSPQITLRVYKMSAKKFFNGSN